jgi:hypothetical protein
MAMNTMKSTLSHRRGGAPLQGFGMGGRCWLWITRKSDGFISAL